MSCTPVNPLLGAEPAGLGLLALVGLLGGAHCVGMCGPLVVTYADRMGRGARGQHLSVRDVRQHTLFNLGRTASYALLGALFGLAGEVVFVSMRELTKLATDVHAVSGVAVGLVVGRVGLAYASGGAVHGPSVPGVDRVGSAVHSRLLPRIDTWANDGRIAVLGAVHGFLPCPLLYPAYLYAFVQGSALGGAAALAALGVGTVPAVFLTGTLFTSVDVGGRRLLQRGLGLVFLGLAYVPLQHGLAAFGVGLPAIPLPHFQPW